MKEHFIADRESKFAGLEAVGCAEPLLLAVIAQFDFLVEQQSALMIEKQLQAADFEIRVFGLQFQFQRPIQWHSDLAIEGTHDFDNGREVGRDPQWLDIDQRIALAIRRPEQQLIVGVNLTGAIRIQTECELAACFERIIGTQLDRADDFVAGLAAARPLPQQFDPCNLDRHVGNCGQFDFRSFQSVDFGLSRQSPRRQAGVSGGDNLDLFEGDRRIRFDIDGERWRSTVIGSHKIREWTVDPRWGGGEFQLIGAAAAGGEHLGRHIHELAILSGVDESNFVWRVTSANLRRHEKFLSEKYFGVARTHLGHLNDRGRGNVRYRIENSGDRGPGTFGGEQGIGHQRADQSHQTKAELNRPRAIDFFGWGDLRQVAGCALGDRLDNRFAVNLPAFFHLEIVDEAVMKVLAARFDHAGSIKSVDTTEKEDRNFAPGDPQATANQDCERDEPGDWAKLHDPRIEENSGDQQAEQPQAECQQARSQFGQLDLLAGAFQLLLDVLLELVFGRPRLRLGSLFGFGHSCRHERFGLGRGLDGGRCGQGNRCLADRIEQRPLRNSGKRAALGIIDAEGSGKFPGKPKKSARRAGGGLVLQRPREGGGRKSTERSQFLGLFGWSPDPPPRRPGS